MASLMRALTRFARFLTLPLLRGLGGVVVSLTLPTLRVLAGVCLVIAAVALASDAGPLTAGTAQRFQPTPAIAHWQQFSPKSLDQSRTFLVKRTRPWIWDALSSPLRLPSFVLFTILGALFGYFGRHRRGVEIFIN